MENETVDEKRAREWFRSKEVTQLRWELTDRYKYSAEDAECKLLAAYAESECSRLASRVAILESALLQAVGEIADYRGVYQDPDTCEQKIAAGVQRRIAEAEKLLAGAHAEEKEPHD